jgi:hypothetical protein
MGLVGEEGGEGLGERGKEEGKRQRGKMEKRRKKYTTITQHTPYS